MKEKLIENNSGSYNHKSLHNLDMDNQDTSHKNIRRFNSFTHFDYWQSLVSHKHSHISSQN